MDTADIITATVSEFCRISGIGRSKTYEMIATGELESILCGGRRLIVIDSWRRLVASAPRDLGSRPATPTAPNRTARLRTAPAAAG
jgi:excisionase family DNA binding protein